MYNSTKLIFSLHIIVIYMTSNVGKSLIIPELYLQIYQMANLKYIHDGDDPILLFGNRNKKARIKNARINVHVFSYFSTQKACTICRHRNQNVCWVLITPAMAGSRPTHMDCGLGMCLKKTTHAGWVFSPWRKTQTMAISVAGWCFKINTGVIWKRWHINMCRDIALH